MDSFPSNADWFKPNFGLKNSLMLYINCCISKCESFGLSNLAGSENDHPISENLLRTPLLFVVSQLMAAVVEGDVQQPFHLSLVLRLLRSLQVFVGSEGSTLLLALAAAEDRKKKRRGLFRRIFVLCRSTIFGIVVCIAVVRRTLDKFVLPFQAVAVVQVLKVHAGI